MGTVTRGRHNWGVQLAEGGLVVPDLNPTRTEAEGDFVQLLLAGEHVKGEFHCAECGYGIAVFRVLPTCPMCGGKGWEQSTWSPFARARSIIQ